MALCVFLFAAIWQKRWQSVEGSWCLKSRSCGVWGGMSPSRLAWRRACNTWRTSLTARVTWVWRVIFNLHSAGGFNVSYFHLDLFFCRKEILQTRTEHTSYWISFQSSCDSFTLTTYPLFLVLFIFRVLFAHHSHWSGGEAPSLRGRPAQLCQTGPGPGGTAAGGAGRVGWYSRAATDTQGHSAEDTNHRRWAAGLRRKTDCPT